MGHWLQAVTPQTIIEVSVDSYVVAKLIEKLHLVSNMGHINPQRAEKAEESYE